MFRHHQLDLQTETDNNTWGLAKKQNSSSNELPLSGEREFIGSSQASHGIFTDLEC